MKDVQKAASNIKKAHKALVSTQNKLNALAETLGKNMEAFDAAMSALDTVLEAEAESAKVADQNAPIKRTRKVAAAAPEQDQAEPASPVRKRRAAAAAPEQDQAEPAAPVAAAPVRRKRPVVSEAAAPVAVTTPKRKPVVKADEQEPVAAPKRKPKADVSAAPVPSAPTPKAAPKKSPVAVAKHGNVPAPKKAAQPSRPANASRNTGARAEFSLQ